MAFDLRRALGPSLRGYRRAQLPRDLAAGVTVAALTVPSALAYAQVVGLPPVYGLYASIVPLLVFGLFASARQQVVGPDAVLSAVIASVILSVAGASASPGRVVALAGMLGLMVGVLFLVMGATRLGFLANFLSNPLLAGFIAGMAVGILVSQLPKMLGFSVPTRATLPLLAAVLGDLGATNLWAVGLSAGAVVILATFGRRYPRVPVALIVIVVGLVVSAIGRLSERGVHVLGDIPAGLPPLAVPFTSMSDLGACVPGAIAIVLIGFADQSLEGRVWAAKGHYEVNANRDLVALGLGNMAGSFAGSYPVGSSSSRTAAGIAAGGRSQVMSIAAAAVIVLVLMVFAPFLTDLPEPVLGAVVAVSAAGLIDVPALVRLRSHPVELGIALVTFAAVVVLGVLPGVAIAVIISLLDVVRRVSAPSDAILGQRPGRPGYFDVQRSRRVLGDRVDDGPVVTTIDGLLIYRFDAPLFFANADRFRSRLKQLSADEPVRWIIIDAGAITDIDATATQVLDGLLDDFAAAGVTVAFANVLGGVRDRIHAHGALIPEGLVFKTIEEAVAAFRADRG